MSQFLLYGLRHIAYVVENTEIVGYVGIPTVLHGSELKMIERSIFVGLMTTKILMH